MNIGCWLADQISRPDWFRHLFLQRTTWGAFSIYSHVKRSNGKPKIAYPTKSKAENAAVDMAKKYGKPFTVYKCLFCDGWHVSQDTYGLPVKEKSTEAVALEKYAKKPIVQATELDVEKVLSTGIPDLAPVYGGFRGRTLSSTKQLHAWNTMMEAGINQIIDLRADYTSDFYSELCVMLPDRVPIPQWSRPLPMPQTNCPRDGKSVRWVVPQLLPSFLQVMTRLYA